MSDINSTLLYKRLSPFLDRGMNRDIYDVNETLKQFFELYFEWLDRDGNAAERLSGIQKYRDIDTTLISEFFEYFRNEYLSGISDDVLMDKRELVKHIREFYSNKGSEKAYRFIFRLLFNDEIEIYYPKDNILKASDGKWIVESVIKTSSNTGLNWGAIIGKIISGVSSGASALVENAIRIDEGGETITELTLSNIEGTFVVGELIEAHIDDETYIRETIFESVSSLDVFDPGMGFAVGDKFPIRIDNSSNEIVGYARVDRLSPSSISGIDILNGGTGYHGLFRQVTSYVGLSMETIIDGIALENTVLGTTNSYGHLYWNIPVNTLLPTALELPDDPDEIVFYDIPSSIGNGAAAVIELVSESGEILVINLLNGGANYQSPSAVVRSSTGSGAVLDVLGASTGMNIVSPIGYPHHPSGVELYVDTPTGTIAMNYSALIEKEGYWKNTDGMLDSDKRIQDGYYYQNYSYDLRSSRAISDYEDFIKEQIHPAGYKMFGTVLSRGYGIIPVLFADIALSFTPSIEGFGEIEIDHAGTSVLLSWADEFATLWYQTPVGLWLYQPISDFSGLSIDYVISGTSPYSGMSPDVADFEITVGA